MKRIILFVFLLALCYGQDWDTTMLIAQKDSMWTTIDTIEILIGTIKDIPVHFKEWNGFHVIPYQPIYKLVVFQKGFCVKITVVSLFNVPSTEEKFYDSNWKEIKNPFMVGPVEYLEEK